MNTKLYEDFARCIMLTKENKYTFAVTGKTEKDKGDIVAIAYNSDNSIVRSFGFDLDKDSVNDVVSGIITLLNEVKDADK